MHAVLFKKMYLKMSSRKWRPFCLGPSLLRISYSHGLIVYGKCKPFSETFCCNLKHQYHTGQYVIKIIGKPAMGLRPSLTRFKSWPTQPAGYVVLTSLGRNGHWWGIRGLKPDCTLFNRWLIEGHSLNDAMWLSSSLVELGCHLMGNSYLKFPRIKHFHYWCLGYGGS